MCTCLTFPVLCFAAFTVKSTVTVNVESDVKFEDPCSTFFTSTNSNKDCQKADTSSFGVAFECNASSIEPPTAPNTALSADPGLKAAISTSITASATSPSPSNTGQVPVTKAPESALLFGPGSKEPVMAVTGFPFGNTRLSFSAGKKKERVLSSTVCSPPAGFSFSKPNAAFTFRKPAERTEAEAPKAAVSFSPPNTSESSAYLVSCYGLAILYV